MHAAKAMSPRTPPFTPADPMRCSPESIVLSSRGQAWGGVEVIRRRHTRNEFAVPALPKHLISIYLGRSFDITGSTGGRARETRRVTNSVRVVPPDTPIEWRWREEERPDCLHLYLDAGFVREFAAGAGMNPDRVEVVHAAREVDSQVRHIGAALVAELERGCPSGRLFGESAAQMLAAHLLKNYSAHEGVVREHTGGMAPRRLRRVIEYVEANLDGDLALGRLAGVAGMNAFHFTRCFKATTGQTPHRFVVARRLAAAKRLLVATRLSISQVGLQVGFCDQSHFTKVFHQNAGITPREYRARA